MRSRSLAAVGLVALAGGTVLSLPSAARASTPAAVTNAVSFIESQQRPDGGFGSGEAGFPGFETPDAVLAIAAAAQTGATWDRAAARHAVEAVQTNGHSGLHYLDDWADGVLGAINAGGAARITVVAAALGIDPRSFDPDHDGATDLVATVLAGEQSDGTWGAGALNTTLTAVLALHVAGDSIDASTVAAIKAAQQANGSWNFEGDPTKSDVDPDTTGLAIEALIAAGVVPTDASVQHGLALLAGAQALDGSWADSFAHQSNPNSTALADLGVVAAGYDPATRCWRDAFDAARASKAYVTPAAAILATQQSDGRFASPNDSFGVNTFATSQGLQAVLHGYQPVAVAPPQPCSPAPPPTTTTTMRATTSTSAAGVSGAGSTSTTSGAGELPMTGARSGAGAVLAVVLLLAGATLALVGRRRRVATQ